MALRDAGYPLSALEVAKIIEPTLGREVNRRSGVERYMDYGTVFVALKKLEASGAICSQKVHTSRLWWARG